ncbi:MAG: glycosyltransferase family 2 protein, partial [Patescibacteria group bacterium]
MEQFVKIFQVLNTNVNESKIAAVQGYQWHVLNKSQTWVTRGVRTEYAGSYVIERSGTEIYGGLKQIAGAVYAIRADVLRQFGWGTSITEDFELTLRLYAQGYKVAFTPYIQAPAEAVSTVRRLIRQRMRWAEGASFNIKVMFSRMLKSPNLTPAEKFEFLYLSPYYLQAFFFVVGTLAWFLSEAVFQSRLPFWTAAFGWSLVFTNLLALPLMNIIGLFLEESDERDYVGILSFIALSYIVVPFQAYAAIKGFLETQEGPWFRTPKTGLITDVFGRSGFGKFFGGLLGPKPPVAAAAMEGRPAAAPTLPAGRQVSADVGGLAPSLGGMAFNVLRADNFRIRPRHVRHIGNFALGLVVTVTVLMSLFTPFIPISTSYAQQPVLKTVDNSLEKTPNGSQQKAENEEVEITTPRAVARTTKDG